MSPIFITAVAVQIFCQAYKVVYYSIREKRWAWRRFISAGGMPSAHSAFVSALSVSVGLSKGFDSDLFAVAAVFSTIIIYDSIRLRGAVQIHSRILERLSRLLPEEDRLPVPRHVGHTLLEIAVGTLVGGILSFLAFRLFF